jgi:membrane protease YdiL (CAAX protease family)
LVVWGLGAVIEISSKKADSFFDVLTLNTPSIAFQSLFIGLAAGGMLFFIGQSVAVPLTNLAVNGDGQKYLLKFLYVVLAAPFVEENFFRGWFMPNLSKFTSAWSGLSQTVTGVLSILVANGFFALYHGWAYGFNANLMFSAFLFGLVSTALLYKTRSIAGSIGLHFVNNLRAFLS